MVTQAGTATPVGRGLALPLGAAIAADPALGVNVEQTYSKQIAKGHPNKSGKNAGLSGDARDHAATQLGVAARYISDARTIKREAPRIEYAKLALEWSLPVA